MGEQTIDPGEIGMISTGVSVQFPRGVYMKISGRSSLNAKGILVIDGTVDADYFPREIKILILNARKDAYTATMGMKIVGALADLDLLMNSNNIKFSRITCDGLPAAGKSSLIKLLERHRGSALFTRRPLRWEDMSARTMIRTRGHRGQFYDRSPYFLDRIVDILERYEREAAPVSVMEGSHIGLRALHAQMEKMHSSCDHYEAACKKAFDYIEARCPFDLHIYVKTPVHVCLERLDEEEASEVTYGDITALNKSYDEIFGAMRESGRKVLQIDGGEPWNAEEILRRIESVLYI